MREKACVNGNFRHAELHLSLGLFCVAASVTVSSRGQEFAPSGSDPLRVDPQVLHQGVRLPGDSQAPGCTESLSRDQPLDLERAASFALCNSPKARATWEAIEVQAGVLGEAKAAYLPSVVSSLTVQRERNLFPGESALDDSKTGHSAYVNGSWRVFDFGGRAANRESAEHLLSAALATHDAKLQEILDAVIAAYFDAVTAKAELEASQRTRSLASDTFAATGRREGKGAASHN